jgi:L-lactate dehydrogenase complex protein LldE
MGVALFTTCCGRMHANSGYFEVDLVRRFVDVFSPYDAVVVPSGSCAASIHHQHPMIARAAAPPSRPSLVGVVSLP